MGTMSLDMTVDERRALCVAVTLNGEPARVTGARNDFAYVKQNKSGLGCEWAWPTVARIIAKGGAFRS